MNVLVTGGTGTVGLDQNLEIDGVVQLAAIPNPAGGTAPDIFHINCTGTFNVYQAAAKEGMKWGVSASSINALGFNFGVKAFQFSYFPIDEKYLQQTTEAYSLSKKILEETTEYFSWRDGISGVCLSLLGVRDPVDAPRALLRRLRPSLSGDIRVAGRRTPGTRHCDLVTVRRNAAPNLPPSRSGLSPSDGWSRG